MMACLAIALVLTSVVGVVSAAGAGSGISGDPAAGRVAYESKCGGCHSLDANRIGPLHRGVVERAPGAIRGYAYSAALKKLGGVWTPARLELWLTNPQKLAPGSKMYLSVSDPIERHNIIAYLQSISPPSAKH